MQTRKIVLIGAGSVRFTRKLVVDLLHSNLKCRWVLGLVDINVEALELSRRLVETIVTKVGANVRIEASTDRTALLPGADIVVTTISVGGETARTKDVEIPRKYGIFQTVGDTVMPGGISRALRMIPPMVDIARDVDRLCPDALFFNYANPMTAICRAVRKETGVNLIGLCHGTFRTEIKLAQQGRLDPARTTSIGVGLNHLTFLLDLRYDGNSAWGDVRPKSAQGDQPEKGEPFSWLLFDRYGAFPTPGDRHVVEFFPEQFPGGTYHGKTLGVDVFPFERAVKAGESKLQETKEIVSGKKRLTQELLTPQPGESEQLMEMLDSLFFDRQKVFYVNAPNQGACPNLPDDAVLELPASATAGGFRPLHTGPVPLAIEAILTRRIHCVELTVEAALCRDRALFEEALIQDGSVREYSVVGKLAGELLEAQRELLPEDWDL